MGRRFVQRLWARRPARGAKWVGRGSGVAFAEAVEPRLLLSGAGDLSPQPGGEVTTIHWHGQETKALAGQWILRSDPQARTRLAEGPLDRVRRFVKARRPDVAVVDDLGTPGLSLLKAPPEVSFDKLARSLRSIPGFRSLQPDLVYTTDDLSGDLPNDLPDDPMFGSLWGLNNTGQDAGTADADIDAPEAWQTTTGSDDVVVAVIDSGIAYAHPDLAANMWHNPGEIAGNGRDDDRNGFVDDVYGYDFANNDANPLDDNGHGTHVAGTIAAVADNGVGVAGVAWHAKLMAVKYLGAGGSGPTSDAVRALNYVVAMRRAGVNVRVANASWGGAGFDPALSEALAALQQADVLFVAAAGNGGADQRGDDNDYVPPHYPSSYPHPNIVAVAATDRNDARTPWTNYGANAVDLAAPGSSILSTVPTTGPENVLFDASGYRRASGTSMAAPHVTGAAALAFAFEARATAAIVKRAILDGVDPLPALAGVTASRGRLNAAGMLARLGTMAVGVTSPADGSRITAPLDTIMLDLTYAADPATVQASDLTVNGRPADSVTLAADGPSAAFHFDAPMVTEQGRYRVHVDAGAFTRASDGQPVGAYDGWFAYDVAVGEVVSVTPAERPIVIPDPVTQTVDIDVRFSEPIDPASIQPDGLRVEYGPRTARVVAVSSPAPDVARFTLGGMGENPECASPSSTARSPTPRGAR